MATRAFARNTPIDPEPEAQHKARGHQQPYEERSVHRAPLPLSANLILEYHVEASQGEAYWTGQLRLRPAAVSVAKPARASIRSLMARGGIDGEDRSWIVSGGAPEKPSCSASRRRLQPPTSREEASPWCQ